MKHFGISYQGSKNAIAARIVVEYLPPYKGTSEYSVDFDHAAFYSWAAHCSRPLLISEYDMPRDIFACIGEIQHVARFSQTNKKKYGTSLYSAPPARHVEIHYRKFVFV